MIDDIRLIAEIKNHPLLYDPGVPENRDMSAKESTWSFIAKSLGYSVRECKMRWKSLRERFARERKKIIMNNEDFASDDEQDRDGKVGSWHLMKHMSFLWNFVIHRNMNRSRSMILNTTLEDHTNPPPVSAPIWLLPNVANNNILQALQTKSINQPEEAEDYGVSMQEKVKDPLCVEEDNSLCFDIDSSDSEKDSKVSKRGCEEDSTRSEIENAAQKRLRRDIPSRPPSRAPSPAHPEVSRLNDRLSRANAVEVRDKDKTQTMFSTSANEGPSGAAASAKQDVMSIMAKSDKDLHTNMIQNSVISSCKDKSDDELFCLSIAASMQRLTAKQRALLKLRIQQVMYEVEFPE